MREVNIKIRKRLFAQFWFWHMFYKITGGWRPSDKYLQSIITSNVVIE